MTAINQTKKITILAVVFAILFSVGTISAATEGTLLLQGTVPAVLEITVTPESGVNDALDLSADITDLKVATVLERSNKKAGYTVTLSSANNGVFQNTDTTYDYSLDYTLAYDGSEIDLSSGSAEITNESVKTTGAGTSKNVTISYNGEADFPYEGTYTDTLTFTIAAK